MANTNKAGTGKRVRRMKYAGDGARGRGHALKSRPGSKLGMPMAEDAEAEDALPEKQRKDARAAAKPHRSTRRNETPDGDRRSRKPSTATDTARANVAAEKTATKRAPTRSQNTPESTGEAKRRKRTGGGFAGEKRAAPARDPSERDED
jgi:hypothetical protein